MPEPVMGSLALRLAAVLVLVAANAFFVAAEFALVAARRTRIEEMIRRGDRKAKTVQQALQDLYRQLSAAHSASRSPRFCSGTSRRTRSPTCSGNGSRDCRPHSTS